MSCVRHEHLPTPFVPADCQDCHPRPLRELMPAGAIGTTVATATVLSDVVSTLRRELGESREEVRRQAVTIDQLRSEVAGLKRGLAQAKRQAKRDLENAERRHTAETTAIVEAMERMNAEGPKQ